jgi:hypothetical protein
MIYSMLRRSSLFLVACALFACGGLEGTVRPIAAEPSIRFVDLKGFDQELGASLSAPLPKVEVGFYDRVAPSQLPERLQKWLAAVEAGGGCVKVTPPPSTVTAKGPLLLLGAVTSLWTANKMLKEIADEARFRAAGGYDAEMLLKADGGGDVIVDKVVFVRRVK